MSDCWTARQQRQLFYITEFTADIVHVPGTQNMVADLMSRPPQAIPVPGPATAAGVKEPSESLAASQDTGSTAGAPHHLVAAATAAEGVDLQLMAREQTMCPVMQQLLNNTSLQLQTSPVGQQNCGVMSLQAAAGHWFL